MSYFIRRKVIRGTTDDADWNEVGAKIQPARPHSTFEEGDERAALGIADADEFVQDISAQFVRSHRFNRDWCF